jgi:deoxyadenosine/deoxycytidine kinase
MERIRRRGRPYEKNMPEDYIETLNKAYNHFFFHYEDTPLLMVNTDSLDLPRSESELTKLMAVINTHDKGTLYYRGGAE